MSSASRRASKLSTNAPCSASARAREWRWAASARGLRTRSYKASAGGRSQASARQRPSTTPSSIANAAPCPRKGDIGCAASPRRVTRPELHLASGGRSWRPHLNSVPASIASIRPQTSSLKSAYSSRSSDMSASTVQLSSCHARCRAIATTFMKALLRKGYDRSRRPGPRCMERR